MSRVSVIIPTFNRAHLVSEAIESVLAQTYQDFEIIAVDDASTDNTQEVLARYQAEHGDKIRVIRRENNGGAGAARNDGILASSGEFLAFLDSDDQYLPRRLEAAVSSLDAHGEYGAVYGKVLWIGPEGGQPGELLVANAGGGPSGWIFDRMVSSGLTSTPTVTVRRDVIQRVGLFDETLASGQDKELWWRIARDSQIGYVDEVMARCRTTAGSLCRSGSRSSGSWVQMCRKALVTYQGLTARQRRDMASQLCASLRVHAYDLAQEGHRAQARAAYFQSAREAVAARLWGSALISIATAVYGRRFPQLARWLRLSCSHLRGWMGHGLRPVPEGDPPDA